MRGEAPGDHKAAKDNGGVVDAVLHGGEEAAGELRNDEALERFFAGTYAGDYEAELFAKFDACLPEHPSW